MEHAKKMVLVDPSLLEKMSQFQKNAPDPISRFDQEMQLILNKRNDDREKWLLYNQILQKYLNVLNHTRRPVELPMIEDSVKQKKEIVDSDDGFQNIVSVLPKSCSSKALLLLHKLKDGGVTWSDNGVVSFEGRSIEDSNIIDLVYDLVRSSRSTTEPKGWEEFVNVLKQVNVPRVLIANQKRLQQLNKILSREQRLDAEEPTSTEVVPDVKKKNSRISDAVTPVSSSIGNNTTKSKNRRKIKWSPYTP